MNYEYIPICKVKFSGYLDHYAPIEEIGAYHVLDLIRGISSNYKRFESDLWQLSTEGKIFTICVNNTYNIGDISDTQILLPLAVNEVEISCLDNLAGKNILPVLLGVALIGAAISGIGILGISTTTLGLMGASLVASAIFKVPKADVKEKDIEKRSNNYSGTINTTGGGQPLPLIFGEGWGGSIVASAYIQPESRSVN